MTTLNDARFQALLDQGFTGATNDMMVPWLQLNGATSSNINDAWLEMLVFQGFSGHRNDAWYALLGSLGYTGQLNDRELAFWADGGTLVPPPPFVGEFFNADNNTPDNINGVDYVARTFTSLGGDTEEGNWLGQNLIFHGRMLIGSNGAQVAIPVDITGNPDLIRFYSDFSDALIGVAFEHPATWNRMIPIFDSLGDQNENNFVLGIWWDENPGLHRVTSNGQGNATRGLYYGNGQNMVGKTFVGAQGANLEIVNANNAFAIQCTTDAVDEAAFRANFQHPQIMVKSNAVVNVDFQNYVNDTELSALPEFDHVVSSPGFDTATIIDGTLRRNAGSNSLMYTIAGAMNGSVRLEGRFMYDAIAATHLPLVMGDDIDNLVGVGVINGELVLVDKIAFVDNVLGTYLGYESGDEIEFAMDGSDCVVSVNREVVIEAVSQYSTDTHAFYGIHFLNGNNAEILQTFRAYTNQGPLFALTHLEDPLTDNGEYLTHLGN